MESRHCSLQYPNRQKPVHRADGLCCRCNSSSSTSPVYTSLPYFLLNSAFASSSLRVIVADAHAFISKSLREASYSSGVGNKRANDPLNGLGITRFASLPPASVFNIECFRRGKKYIQSQHPSLH